MGIGPSKRILLIDGDPAIHESLRRLFCRPEPAAGATRLPESGLPLPTVLKNLEIDRASQGPEGLARLRESLEQHRPYLLVVIAVQPAGEWDGVETVRRLWCEDPAVPVLMLAPAGERSVRDEIVRRLGTTDRFLFASTPFAPLELCQLAAAQIDGRMGRLEMNAKLHSIERKLDRTLEEAAEAGRAKSDFMANISHEIRTPMNAILGFTRLLMKEPLRASQAEKVQYVHNAAMSLFELINNILDYSRLSAGQVRPARVAFDLEAVVRDVVQTDQPAAREKGLSLHYHIVETVPRWLEGDENRFRQVLIQLVSNAIKFTKSGTVHVQVALDEETEQATTVRIMVTDTGVGIPAARQAVIFEGFSQADASTTRHFGGMGLGLAICKQLVDLMGGQIGFRSSPGQGSCFWIILPFHRHACRDSGKTPSGDRTASSASATDATPSHQSRFLAAPCGKTRVLLAEDDRLSRTLAEMLLSRLGCLVDLAGTGREALALLNKGCYDLVLMDVNMPEMDGIEAIEHIRRQEAATARHVPIIVITANALPGDSERCLRAGADAYLAKPFTPEQFVGTVRQYLPGCPDPLETALAGRAKSLSARFDTLQTAEERLGALRKAMEEGDFRNLDAVAGTLKGLLLRTGSQLAADHAMRVQFAARSKHAEEVGEAVRRLEAALHSEAVLAENR